MWPRGREQDASLLTQMSESIALQWPTVCKMCMFQDSRRQPGSHPLTGTVLEVFLFGLARREALNGEVDRRNAVLSIPRHKHQVLVLTASKWATKFLALMENLTRSFYVGTMKQVCPKEKSVIQNTAVLLELT